MGWLLFFSVLGRSNTPDVVGRERAIDGETKWNKNKERREGIKELRREDQVKKNKEVFPEITATKFKSLWRNNYPLGGYSVSKTAWSLKTEERVTVLILIWSLMRATGF